MSDRIIRTLLLITLNLIPGTLMAENINDPQDSVNKEFNDEVKGEVGEQLFIQVMGNSRKNLADQNDSGDVYSARTQHLCMQNCASQNKGQNCLRQCSQEANKNYGAAADPNYALPIRLRPSGAILDQAPNNGKSTTVEYYLPPHP